MSTVTFETVAEAANTLIDAGQRASVRLVTAHLGGGSPNTVLKHLREWKSGRPLVRVAETNLDARITTAIVEQMQRVAAEAAAMAEELATSTEDDLQALAEAQHELEQQIASLTAERDTSRAQAEQLTGQLYELSTVTERQHQHYSEQLTALRSDLATARTHQEQTVGQLAKAEVRLEVIPELQAEVGRLRASWSEENRGRIVAEQNAAVLAARLDAGEKRTAELDAQVKKSDAALAEAHGTAKKATEEAAELRGKISILEANSAKNGGPAPTVAKQ